MKLSRSPLVVLALLGLGMLPGVLASTARADEPEPEVSTEPAEPTRDRWDRILAAEIIGGVDTPYGLFGGAIVVSPIRYLALDLGGGVSRDGGRVAGGARLVLPHEMGALGLRVGFAGGPLSWETRFPSQSGVITSGSEVELTTQRRTWSFVGFVDVSLSLEFRFDLGIYARVLFGVEHALTAADACTSSDGGVCSVGGSQPVRTYIGLALGYAFDI